MTTDMTTTANPRYANGSRRRKLQARIYREETHCAICAGEVDKTIKTPDPYSPEIDEIIPLSQGGDPLSRENTTLVHRICNRCKGTGVHVGICPLCIANGVQPPSSQHYTYITTRQW